MFATHAKRKRKQKEKMLLSLPPYVGNERRYQQLKQYLENLKAGQSPALALVNTPGLESPRQVPEQETQAQREAQAKLAEKERERLRQEEETRRREEASERERQRKAQEDAVEKARREEERRLQEALRRQKEASEEQKRREDEARRKAEAEEAQKQVPVEPYLKGLSSIYRTELEKTTRNGRIDKERAERLLREIPPRQVYNKLFVPSVVSDEWQHYLQGHGALPPGVSQELIDEGGARLQAAVFAQLSPPGEAQRKALAFSQ